VQVEVGALGLSPRYIRRASALDGAKDRQARERGAGVLKHGVVRARRAERRVVDPRGLPVEETGSCADGVHDGSDLLHKGSLAGSGEGNGGQVAGEGVSRRWARGRPVGFGDDDLLAPRAGHVGQTRLQTGERGSRVAGRKAKNVSGGS
jgi:hypothetical protein